MKKTSIILLLLAACFSLAHATDVLHLVVGSNRTAGQINNPYLESCYHNSETDFTHTLTFGGQAATLDLRPDTGIANHIPGTDVCVFNPTKPIVDVFMELFPSEGVRTVLDLQRIAAAMDPEIKKRTLKELSEKTQNFPQEIRNAMLREIITSMEEPYTIDFLLMPRAIKNLAKHMPSGTNLYIEHIPLFSKNFNSGVRNPFSFYAYPLFPDLIKAAISSDPEQIWSEAATRLSSQGVSSEEIEKLITKGKEKQALCQQAIVSVQEAIATTTGLIRLDETEYFALLNTEIRIFAEGFLAKLEQFQLSLSAVVALELERLERLEQSQPDSSINKFLQKQGFSNIQHERVPMNSFNGRRNSWMIMATKS